MHIANTVVEFNSRKGRAMNTSGWAGGTAGLGFPATSLVHAKNGHVEFSSCPARRHLCCELQFQLWRTLVECG